MEPIPLPDLAAILGATVGPMLLFVTAPRFLSTLAV